MCVGDGVGRGVERGKGVNQSMESMTMILVSEEVGRLRRTLVGNGEGGRGIQSGANGEGGRRGGGRRT